MPQAIPLLVQAAVATAVSMAVKYAATALAPKPKARPSPAQQLSDRTVMLRQAITTGKIHFGRLKYSGSQSFGQNVGPNNEKFYLLLTLSCNRLQAPDEFWLNDDLVPLDDEGRATGKWAGVVRVWYGDGTEEGDAALHAALTEAVGEEVWGPDHKQAGWSKALLEFTYQSDLLGSGLPNPSFVSNCDQDIYDPRSETSGPTDNAALCIARYLTLPENWGGFGLPWADLHEDELIAAANICDEIVSRKPVTVVFTTDAALPLTVADKTAKLRTGTRVTVSSSGTLPGGLAAATNYFWIAKGELTGQLATSLVNARAGAAITISSSGSGTHSINVNGEPRYTLNGTLDTGDEPEGLITDMLTAMAGRVMPNGGLWKIRAGAWLGATQTIGISDLVEGFSVNWFRQPRDLINGCKGTFVDPDASWKPTDFPSVSVAAYLEADQGHRRWSDTVLDFTNSPSMAQRLKRIELEQSRRQISVPRVVAKLALLGITAGDTVAMNWPRYGWAAKTFEVPSFRAAFKEDEAGPILQTDFSLTESDENVYAHDSDDEVSLPAAPRTHLADPSVVAPPTSLILESGTDALYQHIDGTQSSRIRARFTAPADVFVISGGQIEIQYKPSASDTWLPSRFIDGGQVEAYVNDVQDGAFYDVRVRAWNRKPAHSDWAIELAHKVIGKEELPADVTGFSAQQNDNSVTFKWNLVPGADIDGMHLRYMPPPFDWDNAHVLTAATRGTLITNAGLPPGNWVVGIKARDRSGNYSANAATFAINVVNTYTVIAGTEQSARWPGVITNGIRHDVSGSIIPNGTVLAGDMTDDELWNQANAYPVPEFTYEAKEIDLGFDADFRAYATLGASLLPGITTGSADPQFDIDYRLAADSYDGFGNWNIGTIRARYIKARARIDTASGVAYLHQFKPVADVKLRDEESAGDITVPPGGLAVTFAQPFHQVPNVGVNAQASGGAMRHGTHESVTTTGFTYRIFNAAGVDVGGLGNWRAKGP